MTYLMFKGSLSTAQRNGRMRRALELFFISLDQRGAGFITHDDLAARLCDVGLSAANAAAAPPAAVGGGASATSAGGGRGAGGRARRGGGRWWWRRRCDRRGRALPTREPERHGLRVVSPGIACPTVVYALIRFLRAGPIRFAPAFLAVYRERNHQSG